MRFLQSAISRSLSSAATGRDSRAGTATLQVYVSDGSWHATLIEGGELKWDMQERPAVGKDGANSASALSGAVQKLTEANLQASVGKVVLFIDDDDVQLVGHRTARLSNFEPRAIKNFGTQQLGGRPVSFGSFAFGSPTAGESETRVLGYIPEDKLESYFFALGKLAPLLTAVTPAAVRCLTLPSGQGSAVQAYLTIHNYFSTFVLVNSDAGLIAVRQLPFGAMAIAQEYADAFGIDSASASEFLVRRSRLPSVAAVRGDAVAELEHKTASFAAIAPSLRALSEDIKATVDYFRYERMAGAPDQLRLHFSGTRVAGLEDWLTQAIDLPVEFESKVSDHLLTLTEGAASFNLLEGSRAGLLKLGNQPLEFTGGKFQTIKGAEPKMETKDLLNRQFKLPSFDKLAISPALVDWASSYSRRNGLAIAGCVAAVLAILLNIVFLTSPAANTLSTRVTEYADAVQTNMIAAAGPDTGKAVADSSSPLWADHFLSVSHALSPDMRLTSIVVAPTTSNSGAIPLKIIGVLPTRKPDNLTGIANFMERLSRDVKFTQRFSAVNFSGADNTNENDATGMTFQVVATSGAKP